MNQIDTIVAQATPIGYGGIGILRISGMKTLEITKKVLGKIPKPRYADYLNFNSFDGGIIDKGIALWFPKPNSFTGEDVLELHCHGGPIILDLLLKYILTFPNVRIAKPGEFSERAFLNEKIDLTQAEAIADLIKANSEQAARSAINSLQGVFSTHINKIIKNLIDLRVQMEAEINFPNEDIHCLSNNKIRKKIDIIINNLKKLLSEANQGCLLNEGLTVVITGNTNVGKSSLFNLLVGMETAIVTNIAGTTRDVLHKSINIDGIPLNILDTAGLRESYDDEVERIGIKRALYELNKADYVLFMVDGTKVDTKKSVEILKEFLLTLQKQPKITIIRNKSDITGEPLGLTEISGFSIIHLSALKGDGIRYLLDHLKQKIGFKNTIEGNCTARRRHLQSLKIAYNYLIESKKKISEFYNYELIAEDLYLAQKELNTITGVFTSEDLLNKIFSSFCIGK
ncbi:tRNA uridine-5-carboxymethylaminomethyl(34) synthesis GTPase MnmE [Candidatus Pantoea edessiphila]|uniref:tRNA modification GTPase MnmE n=1 Tax=Candidatus Pantoea edessiphila TaxID=2044610 RepID=A0A2P5T194_9GAMM|nr:tRNA uridine-5-carboxymethylaminomethyl(34) synthesis GTPase MnmE [Candidatus Pantoea edessiphila]PPI88369.1 tRNA uridine-5-carboxymethylaminomethyl(34) synthesis GTPase MnmE [Candidatus Pantoea edessiphila]